MENERIKRVEVGSNESVLIDKLYGPHIFATLRISADTARGCWVIEREWIKTGTFIEWCTIPDQIDQEFFEEARDES